MLYFGVSPHRLWGKIEKSTMNTEYAVISLSDLCDWAVTSNMSKEDKIKELESSGQKILVFDGNTIIHITK